LEIPLYFKVLSHITGRGSLLNPPVKCSVFLLEIKRGKSIKNNREKRKKEEEKGMKITTK